jgi:hypothetical protein
MLLLVMAFSEVVYGQYNTNQVDPISNSLKSSNSNIGIDEKGNFVIKPTLGESKPNWGLDAQGNLVDYNNLNPTTPSYKAAKEAFLAEHPFLTELDAFKAPGTLQTLAKAMQGDLTSQVWLAANLGFKVGSYMEYCFIAEEVFGPTTAQELIQDSALPLQGNFIKTDPISNSLKSSNSNIGIDEKGNFVIKPTLGESLGESKPNWGIDAQGNLIVYENLQTTSSPSSYEIANQAAKDAFIAEYMAEHPFISDYDKFTFSTTILPNLVKALMGDPTAQAAIATTLGIKVGRLIEYGYAIIVANEVFGTPSLEYMLQNSNLQGNFIKPDPITEALKKQGFGTPLLPPPSEMPSGISNDRFGTPFGTGSDSSGVVGKWIFVKDTGMWPIGEGPMTIEYIIFFNHDGSTYVPEQHYSKWGFSFDFPEGRGTWTQNGNTVSWNHGSSTCDKCYPTTGTIDINRMTGSINGLSWNAKKVEEIAGVGPLVDEGQNGGGGW